MRLSEKNSVIFAWKTVICDYYFPFTINKQFDTITVCRIYIKYKTVCNYLSIDRNNRGNTAQKIAITHLALNNVLGLYLASYSYPTFLSHHYWRRHLKQKIFLRVENLWGGCIYSFFDGWIVLISVFFILT